MNKVRERIHRNRFKEACFSNQIQVAERFETDPDLKLIRSKLSTDYVKMFKKGYTLYIEGDWAEAKQYLEQVEHLKGIEDFPT